jgi:hypothetical protein
VAGDVVTAASNRDRVIVAAGKRQGGGDVLAIFALRDQRGLAIDHGVPDRAGLVVTVVARDQYIASDLQRIFLLKVFHVRLLILCYWLCPL